MKKATFRILSFLLAMLMLVSFASCNGGDTPEPTPPTPDPPTEYTTEYSMPNGWASKVETPMWGDPDPVRSQSPMQSSRETWSMKSRT